MLTRSKILLAAGLLAMAAGSLLARQYKATTLLYFLPPRQRSNAQARSDSFVEATRGWAAPAELAQSWLQETQASLALAQYLDQLKSPASGEASLLWETGAIQVRLLDSDRLAIEISGSQPEWLELYSQGLLQHLRNTIAAQSQQRRSSTEIEDGFINSLEAMQLAEEKLGHAEKSPVALNFGLGHYRDAWVQRLAWLRRRTEWSSAVDSMAPTFVVLSGPECQKKWPAQSNLFLLCGLTCTLTGLASVRKSS